MDNTFFTDKEKNGNAPKLREGIDLLRRTYAKLAATVEKDPSSQSLAIASTTEMVGRLEVFIFGQILFIMTQTANIKADCVIDDIATFSPEQQATLKGLMDGICKEASSLAEVIWDLSDIRENCVKVGLSPIAIDYIEESSRKLLLTASL